jgi:NitT/TauT family transport system ATP-binding protein
MTTRLGARPEDPESGLDTRTGAAGVRLRAVRFSYPSRARRGHPLAALDDVGFDARVNEIVALVGPSGCGKSTILELVCGLRTPSSGSVESAPAVLMPQRDLLLPWLGALDNAALALRIHGAGRDEARERAQPLFERFGLAGFEHARPDELSGGMRQRVAFLRTLLSGKPVLCLDEPFASLDALTRAEMRDWLAGALAREPRTTLLVTHDVEEAAMLADRIVVLTPRPARVAAVLEVPLPRPRHVADPGLVALREQSMEALRS